jgi:bifunctional aspartokinase / homoserine dehydrogenase 1
MFEIVSTASLPRASEPETADPVPVACGRVLKFGGSSLATPACIRDVARIILASTEAVTVVVVSAFQGVTDALLACAREAERRDGTHEAAYEAIAARHRSAADDLLGNEDGSSRARVEQLLVELRAAVDGIRLLGCCPPAAQDVVASFGERLSAAIVAGHLNRFLPACFVDARDFVITDDRFTQANVVFPKTNHAAREYFRSLWQRVPAPLAVVTGFIGRTEDGRTTTVGRNGSDSSAAIVGAALGATAIEIWTDVDGVLSADPKMVHGTFVLPQITYDDARELSRSGAKVLHPATIGPAESRSIPIVIKNTFNPAAPGTLISGAPSPGPRLTRSLTSIAGLTLLTLRSSDVPPGRSTAGRLSHALASRGVSTALATHACSELAISFAVRNEDVLPAIEAIRQEFCFELERGLAAISEQGGQSIVAVVGTAAGGQGDGVSSVFGALARHGIAVNAFAQGTTARSICCVVDASQQSRALNVLHRDLFECRRSLALALVGVGNVGSALLEELRERQPQWRERNLDVTVIAVADSKRVLFAPTGIDLASWRKALEVGGRPMDTRALVEAIADLRLHEAALVDCTADAAFVDAYPDFIDARLHIVTPNKRANVLPWDRYHALREAFTTRRRRFLDSTTVGAGLPVLATVRDLIASGDRVQRIEGIVSGTLSYLFNAFDGSVPFSGLVRDAHARGLTEPDPREDLAGSDVARKLLILARETGLRMELGDVDTRSLLPPDLIAGPFSHDFFRAFAACDDGMRDRLDRARANGAVLRYVATIEDGRARAALQEVSRDHPLAAARGCDNVVAFTSDRYAAAPLVIHGPGAGAVLTAKGLAGEIGKLLQAPGELAC